MVDVIGIYEDLVCAELVEGHEPQVDHVGLPAVEFLHLHLGHDDALVRRGEFVDGSERELVCELELLIGEVPEADVHLLRLTDGRLARIDDEEPAVHELPGVHIRAIHLHSLLGRQEGLHTDGQVVDRLRDHSEDLGILSPREVDQLRVA